MNERLAKLENRMAKHENQRLALSLGLQRLQEKISILEGAPATFSSAAAMKTTRVAEPKTVATGTTINIADLQLPPQENRSSLQQSIAEAVRNRMLVLEETYGAGICSNVTNGSLLFIISCRSTEELHPNLVPTLRYACSKLIELQGAHCGSGWRLKHGWCGS
jgi:hypothetical protein